MVCLPALVIDEERGSSPVPVQIKDVLSGWETLGPGVLETLLSAQQSACRQ